MVNGLRKIAWASGFLFETAPYIYIQKMELMKNGSVRETANFCLFIANVNGKQKFGLLCWQTISGN
jgi:hypothetical protein